MLRHILKVDINDVIKGRKDIKRVLQRFEEFKKKILVIVPKLENIKNSISEKEEEIERLFNDLTLISDFFRNRDLIISNLKKFKKIYDIKIKRMQNILNKIRSLNIVRKELEIKNPSDVAAVNKKVNLISQQIEQINIFLEVINEDILKVKSH